MRIYAFIMAMGLFLAPMAADETQKYALTNQILMVSGIGSFLEMTAQVKRGQAPSPANPFAPDFFVTGSLDTDKEMDPNQRSFWQSFPDKEYSAGLKKQFMEIFTEQELQKILDFYNNPFHSKILLKLNADSSLVGLHERLPGLKLEVELSKNKIVLLQSLINLHKINPLIQDQKEKLKAKVRRQRKLLEILNKDSESHLQKELLINENLLADFDAKVIRYFGKSFASVRESELREIVRVMSKDSSKKIQDAAQLLTNYHYYILEKYRLDFERTKKRNL